MTKDNWEKVGKWYDRLVGAQGHDYHQSIIFPKLLPLMNLQKESRILDLACGQGVLSSVLPKGRDYLGIDASKILIASAKKRNPTLQFHVADVSKPISFDKSFTHAVILLALQNIENGEGVIKNAAKALKKNGKLFIVLNHPCFRIPRQSNWETDYEKKCMARKIDRYFSSLAIPIQMQPGKGEKSATTYSYHQPLSTYFSWLNQAGFSVDFLDELISPKSSNGKYARMENRARSEFPLFLLISAKKTIDSGCND